MIPKFPLQMIIPSPAQPEHLENVEGCDGLAEQQHSQRFQLHLDQVGPVRVHALGRLAMGQTKLSIGGRGMEVRKGQL